MIEGPELCDGDELGSNTCASVGHTGGLLGCETDCLGLDTSGCFDCRDGLCEIDKGENTETCPQDCGYTVTGSNTHACALLGNGLLYCWGDNAYGQLGDGTTTQRLAPVQVLGLTDVTFVVAGLFHTYAVDASGTAFCWGDNTHGQLGDGTLTQHLTPVQVANLTDVTSIAAGGNHTCALVAQGTVFCWGDNLVGQLGDGASSGTVPERTVLPRSRSRT